MRKATVVALPVLSALAISASLAPHDCWFLAWVGLAPLLYGLRGMGTLAAGGLAWLFGCLFSIGAFSWILALTKVSLGNFLLATGVFALYFLLFGLTYRLAAGKIGPWMIVFAPALWVALEFMRSNLGFMAWPWNLLGHSQVRCLPVIQVADITGVYGISFLVVMVNQVLSQAPEFVAGVKEARSSPGARAHLRQWSLKQVLPVAVALGLSLGYGRLAPAEPEGSRRLRVAVVQPNLVAGDMMPMAEQAEHMRVYGQLSGEAARWKPELIVWPSSSLPSPLGFSRLVRHHVRKIAQAAGCHLLVGGAGQDKATPRQNGTQPYSNSEFLISPTGDVEGQYNKIRLLPFNEILPLQDWVGWPQWITSLQAGFIPGESYTLFDVAGVKFGTPICWENLFPDLFSRFVRDGAGFMVSVSNDYFMGDTPGPHQAMAMTVFRAVENRVAVVRATTTGVSGFIGPGGEILETVRDGEGKDLFVSGYLVRDVPISTRRTFYTRHGDLFACIVTCMAVGIVLGCLWVSRREAFSWRR